MQPALNEVNQNLILVAVLLSIIIIILGFITIQSRNKALLLESNECLICKDEVLKEFKGLRHEYNNILQGLVNIIEEEDWRGIIDYKERILEKTQKLNKNNLTQLLRIKNKSILLLVYKLLIKAKESEITINLNIYNDIEDLKAYKAKFTNSLQNCLGHAYEVATKESNEVNLKISSKEQGLSFIFENKIVSKVNNLITDFNRNERPPGTSKQIFFNTFIQKDCLIQEILFYIIN